MSQIITFPPGTFPEPEQQAPSPEALLALLDLLNAQQAQVDAKPKRKIGFVLPDDQAQEVQNGI